MINIFMQSPRRDWFVANTKNLEDIDRVYGSTDDNSSKIIHSILSMVVKNYIEHHRTKYQKWLKV